MGQFLLGCTFAMRREFVMSVLPFHSDISNRHDGQLAMNAVWNNKIGLIENKLIRHRIHSGNAVGIKGSWVFKGIKTHDLRSSLIEPRPLNKYFSCCSKVGSNKRASFIQKRYNSYSSVYGKIRLLLSFSQYIKFYGRRFLLFLSRDLFYGIR